MSNKRYPAPINRHQEAKAKKGLASLLWMFVGAIIAVMIGVFFYLSPLFDGYTREVEVNPSAEEVVPLPTPVPSTDEYKFYEVLPKGDSEASNASLSSDTTSSATTISNKVDAVVEAPKDEGSKTQITIVEEDQTYDDTSTTTETATTRQLDDDSGAIHIQSAKRTYILQIRTYDNPEEADRKRAEVMLAGVEAKVVMRKSPDSAGNDIYQYQVVTPPNSDKEEVLRIRQQLSDNNIDTLLIEQRR